MSEYHLYYTPVQPPVIHLLHASVPCSCYMCTTTALQTALQPCVAVKFTTVSTTCVCSGIPHGIGRICKGLVDPGSWIEHSVGGSCPVTIVSPVTSIHYIFRFENRDLQRASTLYYTNLQNTLMLLGEDSDRQTSDGQTDGRTDGHTGVQLHMHSTGTAARGSMPGSSARGLLTRGRACEAAGLEPAAMQCCRGSPCGV